MLIKVYIVLLFFMTLLALLLSVLSFAGKGGFVKTKEDASLNEPIRTQWGISFLLIAALTLVNALKLLLGFQWLSVVSLAIAFALALFYIMSRKKAK